MQPGPRRRRGVYIRGQPPLQHRQREDPDFDHIGLAPDGTPLRLAADIEQHSADGAPGLFVALRYNSQIEHTVPFFGAYPTFALEIMPPGRMGPSRAPGISCGVSSNLDIRELDQRDPHRGAPYPGFCFFAGWTGSCRTTRASFTLAVDSHKTCGAVFVPTNPVAGSHPGRHRQATGRRRSGHAACALRRQQHLARRAAQRREQRGVSAEASEGGQTATWRFHFKAPDPQLLAPGEDASATRAAFTSGAGLDIVADGEGCNRLSGRFWVYDIAFAADGSLSRFAADAEAAL